jgi:hypothetical protein
MSGLERLSQHRSKATARIEVELVQPETELEEGKIGCSAPDCRNIITQHIKDLRKRAQRWSKERSSEDFDVYRTFQYAGQMVVHPLNSCYQADENHASFCRLWWYSRHPLQIPPEAVDEVWQLPKSIKVEDLGYTSKGRETVPIEYSDEDMGFGLYD